MIHKLPGLGLRQPLTFGGATRARQSLSTNGDAFVFRHWEGGALVAVIDGLGHGARAKRASDAAADYLNSRGEDPLEAVFRGVARVCQGTDGVVMAAARFEYGPEIRFSFASVGNVEARLFSPSSQEHLIVRRGILGGPAPQACVTQHAWTAGSILVLHSDGVAAVWRFDDFPCLRMEPPEKSARVMLDRLAKDEDDATLVVVRDSAEV